MANLTRADLAACFELFSATTFRLEALPVYTVPGEADRLAAFLRGLPLPERSVRTSPWLARIQGTRTAVPPKTWTRIGVIDWPLNDYQRYRLVGRKEAAAAGEVNLIADRSAHPELGALNGDFWLFDENTSEPFAAVMHYDGDGSYLGSEVTTDPAVIDRCMEARRVAERFAVSLETFIRRCVA